VITYDEHGGCYDHVAPPNGAKSPDPNQPPGQDGFLFNRFGVRVPTVLVSPWIESGTICRPSGYTPFDHTSVIATIRRCFTLTGHLTERDLAAPDIGCCLTLATPRTDRPAVYPLSFSADDHGPNINDLHRLIADILEKLTGLPQPAGEGIFQYAHDAYEALMANRAKTRI
jgi:phospholipase C